MNTPFIFTLNVTSSANLLLIRDEWIKKVANASGQDKIDAKKYLDAVIAELGQRYRNAGDNIISKTFGGVGDMIVGSAGLGAGSIGGGMIDATSNTLADAGSSFKRAALIVGVGAIILGGSYIYFNRKGE